jgi:hypothetical protein
MILWLVDWLIYIAGPLAGCIFQLFVNLLAVKFVYWMSGLLVGCLMLRSTVVEYKLQANQLPCREPTMRLIYGDSVMIGTFEKGEGIWRTCNCIEGE